ncbi:COX15/CtaA family protein [Halorientalis salina]|uniref:COX15/CtaA family protein n=1 Tax=Halorientalis salina TaxID=2932266 RepID=UPI0010ACE7B4|nr:COX15/CtaA family protein [Halorientalis salina]
MRIRFRHLAATTTGFTFGLILLGVYTGAIGAGLSCGARWPFCDGWMGLFPATWPSFIEWFHRLVAMVTGFMILGTAIQAWRHDHSRRIRWASTIAVVVLPVQILLGGNTVLNFGPISSVVHHAAAQIIFAAMIATTVWAFETAGTRAATDPEADASAESGSSDPVRL